jgi:hypothetical protein
MPVVGRLGEVANDRLGALHFANSESDRVTGFEKVIWPEWAGSVSSLKQKAATQLQDAVTISRPSHC